MPDHPRARRAVMGALRTLPDWLDFEIHGYRVNRTRLAAVGAAIRYSNQSRRSGDTPRRGIYVYHDPSYRHGAEYDSTHNSLTVGFHTVTQQSQKALVVHEAVHALADIGMGNWMGVQTSEASAHIAQCIVLMDYYGRDATPPTSEVDPNQTILFRRAWAVAQILQARRRQPTWGEYETVWNAVANVREYSRHGMDADMDYHGVPGVPWNVDEEHMQRQVSSP